jgi:hypothetical protein
MHTDAKKTSQSHSIPNVLAHCNSVDIADTRMQSGLLTLEFTGALALEIPPV